jgi:hypothetical protein
MGNNTAGAGRLSPIGLLIFVFIGTDQGSVKGHNPAHPITNLPSPILRAIGLNTDLSPDAPSLFRSQAAINADQFVMTRNC